MFEKRDNPPLFTTQPTSTILTDHDQTPGDTCLDPATGGLRGLDYIASIDRLIVHQRMKMKSLNNEYIVMNADNQPVFVARENSLYGYGR